MEENVDPNVGIVEINFYEYIKLDGHCVVEDKEEKKDLLSNDSNPNLGKKNKELTAADVMG